ncbi:MAG TPA: protein translocase subunit SecD [Negativicutes bacterium]|nr:protein translocase subunit SecD [Negativicutes bacterium]
MNIGNLMKFLGLIVILALISVFSVKPLESNIRQGLDLQGGTHVVLEAVDTPEAKVDEDAVQRVMKIVEQRVNELGLTEPIIQREGERRIIVELPGVDTEKAIEMLGKTAMLEFVDEFGMTVLTGKDLKTAQAQMGQGNRPEVTIEFTAEGTKAFADLTAKNVGRRIAIELDKQVLTAPTVNEPIPGGKAVITGSQTMDEAQRLAILLRSGALPVKVDVMETRTVGPTLGQDSKDKSIKAFAIGVAAIVLFMFLYYRLSGLVANLALVAYVLILLATLAALNATLTLPGIAGIILSMGMAVDANVLIFERFKEEYHNGKSLRAAMEAGFSRAFATILDSHVTTLIAAGVLFFLGTASVKGFAITLALGIVIDLFTAITLTRYALRLLINTNIVKNAKYYGA